MLYNCSERIVNIEKSYLSTNISEWVRANKVNHQALSEVACDGDERLNFRDHCEPAALHSLVVKTQFALATIDRLRNAFQISASD